MRSGESSGGFAYADGISTKITLCFDCNVVVSTRLEPRFVVPVCGLSTHFPAGHILSIIAY